MTSLGSQEEASSARLPPRRLRASGGAEPPRAGPVLEGKTPWGRAQGGGFGNTVQLRDETLVSCSSYRGGDDKTYLEVIRWRLPEASAPKR
jgi:hypothetical protein